MLKVTPAPPRESSVILKEPGSGRCHCSQCIDLEVEDWVLSLVLIALLHSGVRSFEQLLESLNLLKKFLSPVNQMKSRLEANIPSRLGRLCRTLVTRD